MVPKLAAHVGYLFLEHPLARRFQLAADAGFAGADLSQLSRHPLPDVIEGLKESGLPLVQTTTAFGVAQRKDVGLAASPHRIDEYRDTCREIIPYIEATGVRWVHVNSGVMQPGDDFSSCYTTYLDNIRYAVELLAPQGAGVLIEPINTIDLPNYFLGDLELARKVLDALDDPRVKILFDVYHVAMAGRDPVAQFKEVAPMVGHVQLADCPGRHEPGTGTIDFAALLGAIRDTGYSGWISAEYIPRAETRAGLAWVKRLFG